MFSTVLISFADARHGTSPGGKEGRRQAYKNIIDNAYATSADLLMTHDIRYSNTDTAHTVTDTVQTPVAVWTAGLSRQSSAAHGRSTVLSPLRSYSILMSSASPVRCTLRMECSTRQTRPYLRAALPRRASRRVTRRTSRPPVATRRLRGSMARSRRLGDGHPAHCA